MNRFDYDFLSNSSKDGRNSSSFWAGACRMRGSCMKTSEKEKNIDVAIITIKDEELNAVTDRLKPWEILFVNNHNYIFRSITSRDGYKYNVAVSRCLEPGTKEALNLTLNLIKDLNPKWIFLVGIAGGIPAPEYSLGDVLLCTKLYDFSVCCILEKGNPSFALSSYQMAPAAEELLRVLPAYRERLETCGWNSHAALKKERPAIDLTSPSLNVRLYGDEDWKKNVIYSLEQNFSENRKPNYRLGPTASSDRLVKSTSMAKIWLEDARDLANVEMELAGVYQIAQRSKIPILAIRGLSDIVGYKRSVEWTQFACETSASFAICLIQEGLLYPSNSENPQCASMPRQGDGSIYLPLESPFNSFGTIELNRPSYVKRDSDRKMEKLLSRHSFICLHGEFCSGKSSLLIRVPQMLSKEWKVFLPSIELYELGRKGTLERCFFDELQQNSENVENWISISKLFEKFKLVFLIDEIGKCSPQDARLFIEKLYALAEHTSSNRICVVLTIKGSLDVYIRSIGLENPKYHSRWKMVELTDFNKEELTELINLFPRPVALSLMENISIIQERTSMKPSAIQLLCDDLWKHLSARAIPLREIDQQVQQYLEEYRTV